MLGDGGLGYPALASYDRICITAACQTFPPPLIEQLRTGARLIGPLEEEGVQNLVLLEKHAHGLTRQIICQVLYVPLRGQLGGGGRGRRARDA